MPFEEIIKALQKAVAEANIYHGENSREAYYAIESVIAVAEFIAEYKLTEDPTFDVEAFLAKASTPSLDEATSS